MPDHKYTPRLIESRTSEAWSEAAQIPEPSSPMPWRADDPWYVSPHHTLVDLHSDDIETKIAIVESRFCGRIFDQARVLASTANPHHQESGFALLTLATPYFEAINEFLTGQDSTNGSRRFFRAGFRAVFTGLVKDLQSQGAPDPDSLVDVIANAVYDEIRCGLFHNATARKRVRLAWGMRERALAIQLGGSPLAVEWIMVQPAAFAQSIENHFRAYLNELRASDSDSPSRRLFEATFDRRLKR